MGFCPCRHGRASLLYREHDAAAHGLVLEGHGRDFTRHILEPGRSPHQGRARFARRVTAPDGQVLPDTLVVRARAVGEAAESHETDEGLFDFLTGSTTATKVPRAASNTRHPDPNMRWLQAALIARSMPAWLSTVSRVR